MKKTYKIEVDCANCAAKMEDAANKTAGVSNATVSFMTQKMKVEFVGKPQPGVYSKDFILALIARYGVDATAQKNIPQGKQFRR